MLLLFKRYKLYAPGRGPTCAQGTSGRSSGSVTCTCQLSRCNSTLQEAAMAFVVYRLRLPCPNRFKPDFCIQNQ